MAQHFLSLARLVTAMHKLINGASRFQKYVFATQRAFFEKLEQGQAPEALFITCSDARVVPSLITQTKPGELFVLRNAGNIIPPYGEQPSSTAATIEYAIEVLGVHDIIVCGHSACGAVEGIVNPDAVSATPAVAAWLDLAEGTRKLLRDCYTHLTKEELLDVAVEENVLAQVKNLYSHPSVHAKVRSGGLRLHAWVYDIAEGLVLAYRQESGQFEPIQHST